MFNKSMMISFVVTRIQIFFFFFVKEEWKFPYCFIIDVVNDTLYKTKANVTLHSLRFT
jgi:hypothetical protein